jgi:hypothetical protein
LRKFFQQHVKMIEWMPLPWLRSRRFIRKLS